MAGISEQRCRIHKPPSGALRAGQDNICAQSNKRDATTLITFTERKKRSARGKENRVRPLQRRRRMVRTSTLQRLDQSAAVVVVVTMRV